MIAVDTNILVYSCDRAAGDKQAKALELIHNARDCVLLWQVACEFMAASRKLERDGFTAAEAWLRLASFLKILPLVTPSPNVLERAQELHLRQQCSFWDSMLFAACLDAGVQRVYTQDVPGRLIEGLEVMNPF